MRRHHLLHLAGLAAVVASSILPLSTTSSARASGDALAGLASADVPVRLAFEERSVAQILAALEAAAWPTEFEIVGPLDETPLTLVAADKVPLRTVLARLGRLARLEYSMTPSGRLAIRQTPLDAYPAGVDGVSNPRLIDDSKVEPKYPEDARKARVTGTVVLQARIDVTGEVSDLEVLRAKPSDFPSFAEAATDAVRQWRYEPATRFGEPVATLFTIVVEFRLNDQSADPAGLLTR